MSGRKPQIDIIDGKLHQKCHWCNIFKIITEFYPHLDSKYGYQPYCKSCFTEYYKKRNTKEKNRESTLKKYDLNKEDYDIIYNNQEGKCAICKKFGKILHVDHNHVTNKIRGLLCNSCNNGLGLFKDDINILEKAILYLLEYVKK